VSLNSRTCISAISKKNTPINDSQDKKVYQMDSLINNLIKDKEPKFNSKNDFFKVALALFESEGVAGYRVVNNKSKRISNIDNYRKILTFSSVVTSLKDYEVVLHELAHALCRYRGGYDYIDAHGEMFVYFLFYLIKKYFGVNENELSVLADEAGVSYFYNAVLINKSINLKEYKSITNKYDFLTEESSPVGNNEYKTHSGYNVNDKTFISVFANNNTYWSFERKMFKFEETIHIDSFTGMSLKELGNIFIVSPIYNTDVSGYHIKSGKHSVFSFSDMKISKEGKNYSISSERKSDTAKSRTKKIKEMKNKGFNVMSFTDFNQFVAVQNFYIDALKKIV